MTKCLKMKNRVFLFAIFLSIFPFNLNAQDCKSLPSYFSSYSSAVNAIRHSSFAFQDKLPNSKSSWIISANYFSCDSKQGYMIYSTSKGRQYIHEGIPFNTWNAFKNSESSGSYYVYHIKGKYRLLQK